MRAPGLTVSQVQDAFSAGLLACKRAVKLVRVYAQLQARTDNASNGFARNRAGRSELCDGSGCR
jgi:hypothetical protein